MFESSSITKSQFRHHTEVIKVLIIQILPELKVPNFLQFVLWYSNLNKLNYYIHTLYCSSSVITQQLVLTIPVLPGENIELKSFEFFAICLMNYIYMYYIFFLSTHCHYILTIVFGNNMMILRCWHLPKSRILDPLIAREDRSGSETLDLERKLPSCCTRIPLHWF